MLLCGCHVQVGTSNELGGGEGDDVESKVTRIRGLRCAVSPKFNTLGTPGRFGCVIPITCFVFLPADLLFLPCVVFLIR